MPHWLIDENAVFTPPGFSPPSFLLGRSVFSENPATIPLACGRMLVRVASCLFMLLMMIWID